MNVLNFINVIIIIYLSLINFVINNTATFYYNLIPKEGKCISEYIPDNTLGKKIQDILYLSLIIC